jgi:glycosyltransferase involved in cell wall biosynthesis
MEIPKPIGVIYWGKRGGGNRFTFNLCMEMFKKDMPFVVSLSDSNENLSIFEESFPNKIQVIDCQTKFPNLIFSYKNRKAKARAVIENFRSLHVKNILITMPHFLDFSIYRETKGNFMTLTRVIHDYKRHPGDVWPNFFSILLRRFATHKIIYLSNFVREKCIIPKRESIVARFPEEYLTPSRSDTFADLKPYDVLIVGRIRKYKGLHILGDVVKLLNETRKHDFLLAGSGKTAIKPGTNLQVMEKWLTEPEFEALFCHTRIVLLLHEEASQSGIPSIATANGKWIVAPKLGGLAEQVVNGVNGFLYQPGNLLSLNYALLNALRMEELGIAPTRVNSECFSMSLSKFLGQDNKL